eukprot:1314725-Rhodomonas_salina.1
MGPQSRERNQARGEIERVGGRAMPGHGDERVHMPMHTLMHTLRLLVEMLVRRARMRSSCSRFARRWWYQGRSTSHSIGIRTHLSTELRYTSNVSQAMHRGGLNRAADIRSLACHGLGGR